jgi:hypothetical protein
MISNPLYRGIEVREGKRYTEVVEQNILTGNYRLKQVEFS